MFANTKIKFPFQICIERDIWDCSYSIEKKSSRYVEETWGGFNVDVCKVQLRRKMQTFAESERYLRRYSSILIESIFFFLLFPI